LKPTPPTRAHAQKRSASTVSIHALLRAANNLKIHSPYFLLSKISLTKIVAHAIHFSPPSRHNFSRRFGFSTLADNFSTNNMHRQMRRGGVVHGGQR
jgi:hypothetical protein